MLKARILDDVCDVNDFEYVTEAMSFVGDPFDLYFQIFDPSKLPARQGFKPEGLRYIPAVGALVTVSFDNVDDAKKFSRVATQPFLIQDPSIWKVSVLASDPIIGTVNLTIKLNESGKTSTIYLPAAILVDNGNAC